MEQQAYAFKYLRADMQEAELGPFLTEGEANEKRNLMAGFGAKCSAVYPTDISSEKLAQLKAEKESYVAGKIAQFVAYLSAELAVLDAVNSYYIIYDYIRELQERIKRFLKQETPGSGATEGVYTKDIEAKFALYRVEYLAAVSKELERRSGGYGPMEGSVPEDIGKLLQKLFEEVLKSV